MEVPVYFEDLVVGASFLSEEVTIEHEEMLAYNRRNDPWPFHVDEAAAARTPYGSLIASGGYTISLMYRLGHRIYNVPGRRRLVLGASQWPLKLSAAVRVGVGLRLRTAVQGKRVSKQPESRHLR